MVFHCPFTSKAITERSAENRCDSTYRYHCMRTKEGSLTEQCLEISWIQDGKCAIYNVDAKRLDAKPCNENLGICPQKQYMSNDVTSYSACVNLPEISSAPTAYINGNTVTATTSISSKASNGEGLFDISGNMSMVVGVTVGLVTLVVIVGIVAFILYKHRKIPSQDSTSDSQEKKPLTDWTETKDKISEANEMNRYDADQFYKTKPYEHIEKLLKDSYVGILIVGEPGSGKTILLEMLKEKFISKRVNGKYHDLKCMETLEDVAKDEHSDDTKMIYIIDDCFEDWCQYPDLITRGLEQLKKVHEEVIQVKENSVVITMSTWNYENNLDEVKKDQLKQYDKLKIVDMSPKNFQFDRTDKTGILEYQRQKTSVFQRMADKDLRRITDPGAKKILHYLTGDTKLELAFPLSCQLFFLHSYFQEKNKEFFFDTKEIIRGYVRDLALGSLEEKCQYCTLIYVVLCGGKIHREKEDRTLLEAIAKKKEIDTSELDFDYRCCLIVERAKNAYEIIHEEICKLLFTSFGKAWTEFIIEKCEVQVLMKYSRTNDIDRRTAYHEMGLLVITNNLYTRLVEKLQGQEVVEQGHVIFKDKGFLEKFKQFPITQKSQDGQNKYFVEDDDFDRHHAGRENLPARVILRI